jgi:hypothetical protein
MRKLKKQIKKGAEQVSEALRSLRINIRVPKFRKIPIPKFFIRFTLIFLFAFFSVDGSLSPAESTQSANAMMSRLSPEQMYIVNVKDKFERELVTEVKNYINKFAPDSKLDPEYLVEKCLEYETDIVFVLAQGLLESHFGTKGKATETNSVWNVGTYDNGVVRYRYSDPNESLEPYLKLIKEEYLIEITPRGDTIFKDLAHLVRDRGYTNYAGRRYASARGYENGMRKLMVEIDMETSISFHQAILAMDDQRFLAYFKPPSEDDIDYSSFQAMR